MVPKGNDILQSPVSRMFPTDDSKPLKAGTVVSTPPKNHFLGQYFCIDFHSSIHLSFKQDKCV